MTHCHGDIMNYRQLYAMKSSREKQIKMICPKINNGSGIYIFYRIDENEIKHCYVGQAKHLLERAASHLSEYDRIGLSLKKRKFYSKENLGGWKLVFKNCGVDELDENEKRAIKAYADKGYQLYNATSGGQGIGKNGLDKNKSSRGYYDGVEQGKNNAKRFVADLFNKHLDFKPKKYPPTKNQQKAMQKFKDFLDF